MQSPNSHAARGFTLVELMITVGIAAILASIAIPAYTSYIQKGRRADAKAALMNMAAMEERFYSTMNRYTNAPSDLGYGGALPITVGSGYYTVNIPAPTPPTAGAPAFYVLTATAINTQANDTACKTFQIDSLGVQYAADSSGVANTATCWK